MLNCAQLPLHSTTWVRGFTIAKKGLSLKMRRPERQSLDTVNTAATRLRSNQAYVSGATWRPLDAQTEPAMAEDEKRPEVDTGNSELIERSKLRVRLFEGCVALGHRSEHCYPQSGRDVRDLLNANSQHLRKNGSEESGSRKGNPKSWREQKGSVARAKKG